MKKIATLITIFILAIAIYLVWLSKKSTDMALNCAIDYCESMKISKYKEHYYNALAISEAKLDLKYDFHRIYSAEALYLHSSDLISSDSVKRIMNEYDSYKRYSDSICNECRAYGKEVRPKEDSLYIYDTLYWHNYYKKFNYKPLIESYCDCMKKNNYKSDLFNAKLICQSEMIIDNEYYRNIHINAIYVGGAHHLNRVSSYNISNTISNYYKLICKECAAYEDSILRTNFNIADSSHVLNFP